MKSKSPHRLVRTGTRAAGILASAIAALLAVQAASAASLYWDGNGTTAGAGAAPTGAWDTDPFWSTSSAGTLATAAYTTDSDAVFSAGTDAATAAVGLTSNQSANSLLFEDGITTISGTGGIITLTGAGGNITVNKSATAILDASITLEGGVGLTKLGPNTLALNGTLNYTGNTTISAGTLDLTGGSAVLPAGGNLSVGAGATLNLANGAASTTTVAGLTLATGAVLNLDWDAATVDTLTTAAPATSPGVGGYVGIALNPTNSPADPAAFLIQAASGLDGNNYYLVNNTNYTANLTATPTEVTVTNFLTATPLAAAYWKGGLLVGAAASMAASNGTTTSNWAALADGTGVSPLVPGADTDVTLIATGGSTAATLDANMTFKSLFFTANSSSINGNYMLTIAPTDPAKGLTATTSSNTSPNINCPITLGSDQTWLFPVAIQNNNALRTNGTVFTNGKTLTIDGPGTYYVNATNPVPAFSGSGKLIKRGTGTMSFENSTSPNFTGDIDVYAGILQGKSGNSLGASLSSRTLTVYGGTLRATNFGFFGNDPNNFPLIVCEGGTLDCTANGGYTVNNIRLNGGTLQGGQNRTNGNYDSWTIIGTVTSLNSSAISNGGNENARRIQLANGAANFDVQSGTLTVSARFINYNNATATPSTLKKYGAGTMVLSATNTYSGGTSITGGTLQFAAEANLGATPTAATPGYLVLDGGTLLSTGSPTLSANRGIAVGPFDTTGPGTLSVAANQTLTIAGIIANNGGGTGTLIKDGLGTLTLNGSNTHSGGATISNGTLVAGNANALGTAGTLTNNATLALASGVTFTRPATWGAASVLTGTGTYTPGGTFTVGGTGNCATLSPGLGTGAVGTLTIGNDLTLDGGTLTLDVASVSSYDVLAVQGNLSLGNPSTVAVPAVAAGTYNIMTYTNSLLAGDGTKLTAAVSAGPVREGSYTFDTGTTGVVTMNVSGVPTYGLIWNGSVSGVWTIPSPTNWTNGDSKFHNGDSVTFDNSTAAGGTITLTKYSATVALQPGAVMVNNDAAHPYTFSGDPISGTGTLTKSGVGTLTINTANSYTGDTIIGGGTLVLGSATAIPTGTGFGNVVLDGGATAAGTLDLNGKSITLNGLSGTSDAVLGKVVNNNSTAVTLTVGNNNAISSFAGSIAHTTGSIALVKTGAGTLTLSGSHSYTGTTNVTAGTLQMDGSLGSPGGTVTVPAGGTLNVGAGGNIARSVTVGGGILHLAGTLAAGTTLRVTSGTLTTTAAPATVATADFSAGAGTADASSFPLTVTNRLYLPDNLSITLGGGGSSFTLSGANLVNPSLGSPRTLTASGGLLTLAKPTYPGAGLLGKWTFDGQNANDSSGNNYHGTEVATPTYATDTHTGTGYSLALTGANYVKVDTSAFDGGTQSTFDGGTAMTVSAWVKGWPGTWSPFVGKNGEEAGWQMRKNNTTSNLAWTTRGGTSGHGDMSSSSTAVSNGNWHMVTMTYDASGGSNNKKIYVDGALDNQTTATGSIAATAKMLAFGARNNNSFGWESFFTGKLDDIYFYNRALTAAEISSAYASSPSTGLDLSTTDLAVTATSEVSLPTGVTTFGNLSLSGAGTALTLSGATATDASFDNVAATDSSSLAGTVPVSLRTGNVTVADTKTLTVSARIVDGTTATAPNKLGTGSLVLAGVSTYTGNTTVSAGSLVLADNAGLKFVVTDASNNKITGAGAATLDGDFTINTATVTLTTGSWTLVDVATKSFGGSFTVTGAGWAEASNVWTKTDELDPTKIWTFTEATGVLTLAVVVPGYDAWATAKGLTGGAGSDTDPAPGADPDHDGRSNLEEYAFDGNPLSGANAGKVLAKVATLTDASKVLTLTLPVRSGASFSGTTQQVSLSIDGIVYTIEGSDTLEAEPWNLAVEEITGADAVAIQAGLPALSDVNGDLTADWTYRTFRTPGTVTDGDPRDFLRAMVTKP
ncbi:MAG: autotransporter-associated beta strand repeat-containing protein [Verrucomicrobia bacterium]|nr:autotransporter-associated beta strand repeat-containing protein [Verrucomicrobiota bacterium]